MTQEQAEKAANIIIGAAALGAAYFILRDPSLRRTVWRAARGVVAATAPALIAEARRVWDRTSESSALAADSSRPPVRRSLG